MSSVISEISMENKNRKNVLNRRTVPVFVLLVLVQCLFMIFVCSQKQGYHEDELYSYYSTARTAGFYYTDRTITDTQELLREFTVQPGEEFRYGLVKEVQSWDVHPPFYYFLLHTVESLTPGVFSKWQGLGLNIFLYILCQSVLYILSLRIFRAVPERKCGLQTEKCALLTCVFCGFMPAAASAVLFIRMYVLLTLMVLLCCLIHIDLLENKNAEKTPVRLALLAVLTFFGFMTHYYYLVFHFFAGCAYLLFLVRRYRKKAFGPAAAYCVSSGIGGVLGVLFYPAALAQIFSGYRGREAQSEFADVGNTLTRFRFFAGLIDKYAFSGSFLVLLIISCLAAAVFYIYRKKTVVLKKESDPEGLRKCLMLIGAASLGYFLAVSKTALLLGASSLRYMLPIVPVLGLLAAVLVFTSLTELMSAGTRLLKWHGKTDIVKTSFFGNREGMILLLAVILFLSADLYGIAGGRILFRYPEEKSNTEAVDAYDPQGTQRTGVVLYNPQTPDNIWRQTPELLSLDRLYYADESNTGPFEGLRESFGGEAPKELLIFAADHDNRDVLLDNLRELFPELTETEVLYTRDMWTVLRLFEADMK